MSEDCKVPFSYGHGSHIILVSALVNDKIPAVFGFDSGIGLNLVFKHYCNDLGCTLSNKKFSGKRMSGQEVSCEIGSLRSLMIGSKARENVMVGVMEMNLPNELFMMKGMLSLNFFEDQAVTLDYDSRNLILESATSLANRAVAGICVPIELRKHGPSTDIFADLELPTRETVKVEVDTGSDILVLSEEFMDELGAKKNSNTVRKVEGNDETGNSFARYFTSISGRVSLGNGSIFQDNPEVMFQKIIHGGLVGHSFLKKQHAIIFDLPRSRMIFSKPLN
jgi:predicted aspartyl protease